MGMGPNRCSECSLIHVLSASYGAGTVMTFKETILVMEGNYGFFFLGLSVGEKTETE